MQLEQSFMNLSKDIRGSNMAEDFDPKKPSEGLGDTVAKVTNALGIDKLAEKIAHLAGQEDCGCNRRREKLNELFPYKKEEDRTE